MPRLTNFTAPAPFSGPKWAKLWHGKIKGAEPIIKNGIPQSVYSGLFTVVLEDATELNNIPMMPGSYDPKTNAGFIRLFNRDEEVLVGETMHGLIYILGSVLSALTDATANLPVVGGFNRPMSPGEVVIGGPRVKMPERSSFIFLDKSGGIELKANSSHIKVEGETNSIEVETWRYSLFTESGHETWGPHPLIGNAAPPGVPRPGQYTRLVRAKASDNWGQFVYTEQGNLGMSSLEIEANPITPIHLQNFNNTAAIIATKSGGYSIMSGLPGPEMANARQPVTALQALKLTAPLSFDLEPLTQMATLQAPIVSMKGGLTGTEGTVMINASTILVAATSTVVLNSGGTVAISASDVKIQCPNTTFMGNVTIAGNLTVQGMTTATAGLNSSGTIVGAACLPEY
jgi:hypothetical protein